MNQRTLTPPRSANMMKFVGVLALAGVFAYLVFMAANGLGLEELSGTARVTHKERRPPGTTYVRQIIGGRMQTLPQSTPEMFVVSLVINGQETTCGVTEGIYNAVCENANVAVTYQRTRLTGALEVTDVRP